ncbi:MAG: TIGR01777 family oxidoreductase [Acidimicrobiia bacterium]|nr:MAG: TIGR01777 family oxidoreductase [Acidimicrobiia bacterium]
MTRRIVVAGASGLIGSALVEALAQRGDDVVQLVRRPARIGEVPWDPSDGTLDPAALSGADVVVSLNGAGIGDKRWTPDRKEELRRSRVDSVGLLARTMSKLESPPPTFVAGSATGYYGDTGDEVVDETAPMGDDFLATLCGDWEAACTPARDVGVRVVNLRTGIVLGPNGGALAPLLPIFKAGLGGPIGRGTQWWSWVTLDDHVRAMLTLIDGETVGPVNLVAPNPVRQKDFAKALGEQLHRPAVLPAPRLAVKARLGKELAEAIGFASQRVEPAVLARSSFEFEHPDISTALAAVLS